MMKASDVMVPHVITIGPELDVRAVANTLAANGIGAARNVVGICAAISSGVKLSDYRFAFK